MGNKYGKEQGKIRAKKLRGNSDYFSKMAKKLQKLDSEHSRRNMKKAHETMKKEGTFYNHQRKAALKCMKKNPDQLKHMSKKSHELYPLALLALESKRRNYPYEFMDCFFDSDSERKVCRLFVENGLMKLPKEGENVHFKINKAHVDFFIQNRVFVEFHPLRKYGRSKGETSESYYEYKRKILDENGFKNYPLVVIEDLRHVEPKIKTIKKLLSVKLNKGK